MILIACIDDKGGMLFNSRRQSQDGLLREDLLKEVSGRPLWMSAYSAGQFRPVPENVRVAEDFASRAGEGEYCFFEDADPASWLDSAEKVILYHWNRHYPADRWFPLPLTGRTVQYREDFAGSSHECITKEIYV